MRYELTDREWTAIKSMPAEGLLTGFRPDLAVFRPAVGLT